MSQLVWEIFIGHSVFDYQDLFSNKQNRNQMELKAIPI